MAAVDPTKPVFGTPTTASVRANFAAPASLQVYSDATATVIVNGWFVKVEKILRAVAP